MEFLIDRKFWNLVIKKLKPKTALMVKKDLKKRPGESDSVIKKDLVLNFDLELNDHIFRNGFFEHSCINKNIYGLTSSQQNLEIEQAILEVLIETKGLSEKSKYKIWGHDPKFIIEQQKPINSLEKGFVYLIRNDDIYKIGITDNLLRRFNQLKPDEVLNVVRCSNFESLEKELHKKFKEYRIPQTEYFRL